MIDKDIIKNNPEKVREYALSKGADPKLIDEYLKASADFIVAEKTYQEKHRKYVEEATKIEGSNEKKVIDSKDSNKLRENVRSLKKEKREAEIVLQSIDKRKREFLKLIPNIPASDVKKGKGESENEVIKSWGKSINPTFKIKDHSQLGRELDIIDVERASKVSGSRFGYLKGDGVLLELALINFAFSTLIKEKFVPVIPPTLIKKESMDGMGYMEQGGKEDMYLLDKDGLVLVGTAEQSLGSMHKGEILNVKDLPIRYVGFSSCFRREAGSYGKDTKGIFRVHQFDKVEMLSITKPDESDKEHDFLLSIEEKLFQALKIPYQVVKMCTGDLGHPVARKYDIEAWFPSEKRYREVTSTSTTTDYQARRLKIKYKEGVKTEFVHILNGTAFAIGRTILAILENYQKEDGSVEIPEVLKIYMGKDKIVRR
ncbi:MAG: serine--tRNA ligase [bacterium]